MKDSVSVLYRSRPIQYCIRIKLGLGLEKKLLAVVDLSVVRR